MSLKLPFGKFKRKPLADVPDDYLLWALRKCRLSSGLCAVITGELQRRNLDAPTTPPPVIPACRRCGDVGYLCRWRVDRLGRKLIRADCRRCGRKLTFVPLVPPFTEEAC